MLALRTDLWLFYSSILKNNLHFISAFGASKTCRLHFRIDLGYPDNHAWQRDKPSQHLRIQVLDPSLILFIEIENPYSYFLFFELSDVPGFFVGLGFDEFLFIEIVEDFIEAGDDFDWEVDQLEVEFHWILRDVFCVDIKCVIHSWGWLAVLQISEFSQINLLVYYLFISQ